MQLFGVYLDLPIVIIGAVILLVLLVLIVLAIRSSKKEKVEIEDPDKRTEFGDFHGLLTKEDFEQRCEDHMLEIYRKQWIMAEPGDQKDNYLLLYLALKQLNKEQDESENEWTQEQCEARMDEIIKELSEKTGLKLLVDEMPESEFDTYFNDMPEEEDENVDRETEESDEEDGKEE